MPEISYERVGNVDILSLGEDWNDDDLEKLVEIISTMRQQGSRHILLLGNNIKRIRSSRLEELTLPIRIFRGIGGKFAVAEFGDAAIRQLRSATWYRFLNVFHTKEEALQFLNPPPTIDG